MNRRFIHLFFALVAMLSFNVLSAATIIFTGGGDGISWEDPANWDAGTVPTFVDDVILNGTNNVTISTAGNAANSLHMSNDAVLTINTTGVFSLNFNSYNGDMVHMQNRAKVVINGAMTLLNADDDAINMDNNSELVNNGFLNIAEAGDVGLDLNDQSSFTNMNNFSETNADIEMQNGADLYNFGSITIFDACDAIEIRGNARFENDGSVSIVNGNCDGVDMSDSGSRFENRGMLSITMGSFVDTDNGLEIEDGFFFNRPTGTINLAGSTIDAITTDFEGRLDNEGMINIQVNASTISDDGIDMDCNSRIRNFNVINIEISGSMAASAVELDCGGARFINDDCGVVNITSQHQIEVNYGNLFRNRGVVATVFS